MKIVFLKQSKVNRAEYKKGDTLNVSSSLRTALVDKGDAKDFKEKKPKKEEDK